MATAAKRLITADEFLEIEWDDSEVKAELDNGVIRIMRMMAGGSGAHSRVQGNVFGALFVKLKGSKCRAHGPGMAVRYDDWSVRYPDVSVYCGREGEENDRLKSFDDPRLVVEVLSPTTAYQDVEIKLAEYQNIASLHEIVYVDPDRQTVRLLTRNIVGERCDAKVEAGDDLVLAGLGIALTWDEIFAR